MKKILTAAIAALTLGGAAVATATPAAAYPWHGGGYYHGWHGGGGAVAAGLAGLVVGAAIAGSGPHYAPAYYGPAYYGPPAPYGVCYAPRRVWDPYYGGWVVHNVRYPC